MRVAVAYENGEIYGHFGHCETFAVYEYGETINDCTKILVPAGDRQGHRAMAELMREQRVDAVLCGNMGGEAKAALLGLGIVPITGYAGDADTAADLLVTGQLPVTPETEALCGGCDCGGACGGCSGGCGEGCGCG